ncbi:MAG: hypothetical protein ACRDRH_24350, partial [Pseudonocardia sp.]
MSQRGDTVEIVAVTRGTPLEGGGYMWHGEMRVWDNEVLMGWYIQSAISSTWRSPIMPRPEGNPSSLRRPATADARPWRPCSPTTLPGLPSGCGMVAPPGGRRDGADPPHSVPPPPAAVFTISETCPSGEDIVLRPYPFSSPTAVGVGGVAPRSAVFARAAGDRPEAACPGERLREHRDESGA